MAKIAQWVCGPDSKSTPPHYLGLAELGGVSNTPRHSPPAGGARPQRDAPTRRKKGVLHDLTRAGGFPLSRARSAVSERGIRSLLEVVKPGHPAGS